MRNARFWIWANDQAIKMTLKPGQRLTHYVGGPTEEGWHAETTTWEYLDGAVYRDWVSDGRDCDGRLTRGGQDRCAVHQLSAGYDSTEDGVTYPAWQETRDDGVYDEYAQRAGY
jgi:hypothetical protein